MVLPEEPLTLTRQLLRQLEPACERSFEGCLRPGLWLDGGEASFGGLFEKRSTEIICSALLVV